MSQLRRLVLVRHGETDGESSIRYHGTTDVDLSSEGRAHMRQVAGALGGEHFDLVAASPLRRSWRAAWIVGRGVPVRLEPNLREIHFGRWEGMTREEIEASDPILFADWQGRAEGFEFPGGEIRAEFRSRVERGIDELLAANGRSALLVVHKGVIRVAIEHLTGETTKRDEPALGEIVTLTRNPDGTWFRGQRSSDPAALTAA